MASFVLVPGAWHGAWCWERIVPLLEAAGHRAHAPDLIGMTPGGTPPLERAPGVWGEQIAEIVRAAPEPVVLVGHSRGGVVISEAAERAPDHIRRLVYLAAFLIPNGTTISEAIAGGRRENRPDILAPGNEAGTVVVRPEAVVPTFYNLTDPAWAARAAGLLLPEPLSSLATPLRLSAERFGSVSRAYLECSEDRAVPLAQQRAMQGHWPCAHVLTLKTDHSPFYSAPETLAAALIDIGERP